MYCDARKYEIQKKWKEEKAKHQGEGLHGD